MLNSQGENLGNVVDVFFIREMSLTQSCLVFLQQRHIGTNLRLPTQEDGEGLASTQRLHWFLFYLLYVSVCFLTSDDKQPVKKVQTQRVDQLKLFDTNTPFTPTVFRGRFGAGA